MKTRISQFKAKCAFATYRGLGNCLSPFLRPYMSLRAIRGKEDRRRRKERFGRATKPRPSGSLVWLHSASVGETVALVPMIEHILSLGIHVLLTTGTMTSAALVESRFGERVIHQYIPLDYEAAIERFLDHWRPNLVLTCESEVWPVRIMALAQRRIPQIMVNAHLSDKSFAKWKKHGDLARFLFAKLDMAIGQSETDAQRFRDLGVRSVAISGNLKADVAPLSDPAVLDYFRRSIGKRPVWAAISTHEGEELIAAKVHEALKHRLPSLMTIIVPRHPERTPDILGKLDNGRFRIVQKSTGAMPDRQTDILIGDTIGDMGLYLRLAKVAFIGKSLTDQGGHNPLEPALIGSAIISGPHVENFAATYAKLHENHAVRFVEDATQLAVQVSLLLTKPDYRRGMINAAYDTATRMSGALERTMHVLYPFLQPLIVEAKLRREGTDNAF